MSSRRATGPVIAGYKLDALSGKARSSYPDSYHHVPDTRRINEWATTEEIRQSPGSTTSSILIKFHIVNPWAQMHMCHTSSYRRRRIVSTALKNILYGVGCVDWTPQKNFIVAISFKAVLMNSCDNNVPDWWESHVSWKLHVRNTKQVYYFSTICHSMLQNNRCRISRWSSELLAPRLPVKSGNWGPESMHHPVPSPRAPNSFERQSHTTSRSHAEYRCRGEHRKGRGYC